MGRPWSTGASREKPTTRARASIAALRARGGEVVQLHLNAADLDRLDLTALAWRVPRAKALRRLMELAYLMGLDKQGT